MESLLGILFLISIAYIILSLHEGAHGLAMYKLGVTIESVFLGVLSFFSFRINKGFPIHIGIIPVMAGVVPNEEQFERTHWVKKIAILAAGPLSNIILFLLLKGIVYVFGSGLNVEDIYRNLYAIPTLCNENTYGHLSRAISITVGNYGLLGYLSILGFLNLIVGVANFLPIPGLDGSKIILAIVEGIFGEKVKNIILIINIIGGIFILFLVGFDIFSTLWVSASSIPASPNYNPC